MELGAYLVTVVLTDYEGNASSWPITIQVTCVAGNRDPLCYTPEDDEGVATTSNDVTGIVDGSTETVDTITPTDSLFGFT